jgi:hypothetical protein
MTKTVWSRLDLITGNSRFQCLPFWGQNIWQPIISSILSSQQLCETVNSESERTVQSLFVFDIQMMYAKGKCEQYFDTDSEEPDDSHMHFK